MLAGFDIKQNVKALILVYIGYGLREIQPYVSVELYGQLAGLAPALAAQILDWGYFWIFVKLLKFKKN